MISIETDRRVEGRPVHIPARFNTNALSPTDIRNLALQRTASLAHLPVFDSISPSFEVWKRPNSNLLLDVEVRLRKSAILARCFEKIAMEFDELVKQIDFPDDMRILDIGCGLGVIDIFFCRKVAVSRLGLVDIEQTESKHHGFRNEGAGYNSLTTAANFIADNIPDGTRFETFNPKDRDARTLGGDFNLTTSLLSCGYHYPAATDLDVFVTILATKGQIIIDLRRGQDHQLLLNSFEIRREISLRPNYQRVVLSRRAAAWR